MSEIKSKIALQYLHDNEVEESVVELCDAEDSIFISETELTESHAKELKEFKDKAMEIHRKCCSFYSGFDGGHCSRNGS